MNSMYIKCLILSLLFLNLVAKSFSQEINNIYSEPPFYEITLLKNVGYIVGMDGRIYKTNDSGESWQKLNFPTYESLYGLSFINQSTGYVVGFGGLIYKTVDGGKTWIKQKSSITGSGVAFGSIFFVNEMVGYIACGSGDAVGYILKTKDGGNNWTKQKISHHIIEEIYFFNANTGIAVGPKGYFIRTTNGGLNWEIINNPVKVKDEHDWNDVSDICFVDNKYGWVVGTLGIIHTKDAGISWIKQTINGMIQGGFETVYFINESIGWIGTNEGEIFKTINGGNSWKLISNTKEPIYDIEFMNDLVGIAVGASGSNILRTKDGGLNWSPVQYAKKIIELKVEFDEENLILYKGKQATISGRISRSDGQLLRNQIIGLDDGLRKMSTLLKTNSEGRFSFSHTPTFIGTGVLVFYFKDYPICYKSIPIMDSEINKKTTALPLQSISIKNESGTNLKVKLTLFTNNTDESVKYINLPANKTTEVIKLQQPVSFPFKLCSFSGVQATIGMVAGGDASITLDCEGKATASISGGIALLRGTIYWLPKNSSEIGGGGVCWSPGGDIGVTPESASGEVSLCLGTDGLSISGSMSLSAVVGGIQLQIIEVK